MSPDAFTLTFQCPAITAPPPTAVRATLHITLRREQQGGWFFCSRDMMALSVHHPGVHLTRERADYRLRFERLSPAGMEAVLVRALRRSGLLTVGLLDVVRLLGQAGQTVRLTEVHALLGGQRSARLGLCTSNRWTLLPWERLQVPWNPPQQAMASVQSYVQVATHFWVSHGYVPGPDEEPNEHVRTLAARPSGPRFPAWLQPDPFGPLELTVRSSRKRYGVWAPRLPEGHLGIIWMQGERWRVTASRGRLIAVGAAGRRWDVTRRADEVIVRLVAAFKDPAYQAQRSSLGADLYRTLRAHHLKIIVNESR